VLSIRRLFYQEKDFEKLNLLVQLDTRFQLLFLKDLDTTTQQNLPNFINYFLKQTAAPYVMSLDATTRLRPQALDLMLAKIYPSPKVQMVYADHDEYLMKGQRAEPNFKPDWNGELFYSSALCENAIHSLSTGCYLMKREIWSHFCQSSTLHIKATDLLQLSLILSALELINSQVPAVLSKAIVHIPLVFSHHQTKVLALQQRQSIANLFDLHFQQLNINASIALTKSAGKINYPIQHNEKDQLPLVSIIIPTRNNYFLLKQCLDSIIEKTSYKPYEIIVIDNGSNDEATLKYFKEIKNNPLIKVIRDNDVFNYSSLNNHAVELAKGQFIALLNDDIQVIESNWLHEMIAYAQQAHIGVVGAKLYYPNYTIQHAGVVLVGSIARHVHKGLTASDLGYCSRAQLAQSYTAVTAACLVVKRSIYKQLNGLNSLDLTVGWNDIDFCLRVKEAGYENIWTPHAQLLHHESATRGQDISPEKRARAEKEFRYMQKRWGQKMNVDVAYNPNLTDAYEDFSYAWPPRGNI
jgi:O-antigen biosynthesis protein